MKHGKQTQHTFKDWLLLALLLTVSGCGTQSQPSQTPPPSPSPVISPTPVVTETPLPAPKTQGRATTQIYDNLPNRNNNLKLAISAVNGKILAPGEVFSFNETVGPRTEEKGYGEAIGYDEHGEKKPTIGGGVCQISTTLYMAAKNGEFPILERHSHSHEVPYADSDNDATVSYGGYDFKFQNNLDKPVSIRMSINGNTVVAELLVTN